MPGLDPKVDALISGAMLRISAGTKPSPESATVEQMSEAVPRPELDAKLDAMRQEMRAEQAGTKAAIADVRTAVAGVEGKLLAAIERGISETQRWMIATVIGLFIGFGGLFLAMSNALKPAPASPQQPTVIVLPAQTQAPAASR